MIEVALLAASVVKILVPYLKRGADGLADAIGEKAEGGVADFTVGVAKSVWDKVRGAFTASDQESAVKTFEQNPEAAQGLLETLLKQMLESDESLARELNELVEKKGSDGRNAIQIMNSTGVVVVQGDVVGGIVGGSIGAIHQSPAPPSPPPPDE
jgi:hypothetical protein